MLKEERIELFYKRQDSELQFVNCFDKFIIGKIRADNIIATLLVILKLQLILPNQFLMLLTIKDSNKQISLHAICCIILLHLM